MNIDRPIYAQIYHQILAGIIGGAITGGETLSPIRSLAASLGVSPGTVARAYELLAEQRLTISNRRGGTTIAPGARATAQNVWRLQLAQNVADALRSGASRAQIKECIEILLKLREQSE